MRDRPCIGFNKDGPCDREIVDDSDWCIFHHPNKSDELNNFFMDEFNIELIEQEQNHPDYYDFTEWVFPIKIEFSFDLPKSYFNSTVFKGDVIFHKKDEGIVFNEVEFKNTVFEKNAYFMDAVFLDEVGFTAVFMGDAAFVNAEFHSSLIMSSEFQKTVLFHAVKFQGLTLFNGSKFQDKSFFNNTEFYKNTFFNDMILNKYTYFTNSSFNELSIMSNTILEEGISLFDISIKNNFSINNCHIGGRSHLTIKDWGDKNNIYFFINNVTLKNNSIFTISGDLGKYDDKNNIIYGISILNSNLDQFNFIDEDWPKLLGRKIIIDELLISDEKYNTTPDNVAQTYRRLRINYENNKKYAEAGDSLVGEYEIKRLYISSIWDKTLLIIYKEIGLYGESVFLPILWSFLFIILFSEYRCILLRRPEISEFLSTYSLCLSNTLKAFFPFNRILRLRDVITRIVGSLLIGTGFIAVRRRLERK